MRKRDVYDKRGNDPFKSGGGGGRGEGRWRGRGGAVEGERRGNPQLINLFRLSSVLLTGQGAQQYRGLLVQGRHGATPVGSFSATPLTQPTCPGVSSTDISLLVCTGNSFMFPTLGF